MTIKKISLNYFNNHTKEIINEWPKMWFKTPWEGFIQTKENALNYFTDIIKNGIFLLIFDKNKIIGYLTCFINEFDDYEVNEIEKNIKKEIMSKYKSFSNLSNIVLDINYRGKKIGQKIVTKLFEMLKKQKNEVIFLYSEKTSQNHNFYLNLGFTKYGPINRSNRPDLARGYEDRIYFIKELILKN